MTSYREMNGSAQKRHVRVACNYVRQEVDSGHVTIEYVASQGNPVDGFTRPLERPKFE